MAKRLTLFALAVVCVISCVVLPIAAEFVPADYVEYPTMNAFPYPYEPQSGFMANYISYRDDKSIYFAGTPQGGFDQVRSSFILRDWQTGLNVDQKVTLSIDLLVSSNVSLADNVILRAQVVSSVGGTTYYDIPYRSGKVTFEMKPTDKLNVYLRFNANVTLTEFNFYPVLNYGTNAYPYQPYMNAVLDNSYDAGVEAGRGQGFNEGVIEGLNRAEAITSPAFTDIHFQIIFVKDGNYTFVRGAQYYTLTYEGISFASTLEYLQEEYATLLAECDFLYLDIGFDKSICYQTTPIMILGEPSVNSALLTVDYADGRVDINSPYVATAERVDTYSPAQFTIPGGVSYSPAYITNMELRVDNPSAFLGSFLLYCPSGTYDNGYVDGLKAGLSENTESAYQAGSTEGYAKGYTEGKKEGLKAADGGDFLSLMTAVVEAPVRAFQSLFNFTLFGFDMRGMISSVLTISVFLLILKKLGVL